MIPWVTQMLGFALLLFGIAIALWISFWVLIVLFVAAIGVVVYSHLKSFLLGKGILNPTPGVPPEQPPAEGEVEVTIVEGNFMRLDELVPQETPVQDPEAKD